MSEDLSASRRRFHIAGIFGLWSAISAGLGLPALVYLLFPHRSRNQEAWIEVGDAANLARQGPEEVVFRRNRQDGWKLVSEKTSAWVVRGANDELVAFAPQCTHLGCAYHWNEKQKNFLCPCHTSTFGLDGKVLEGPAPRPLDRYAVKVEGGRLLLGPITAGEARS